MKVPQMIGTTGTTFTVVGVFPAGHIGYRALGGDQFRVRIAEYKTKEGLSSSLSSWKQPQESNVRTRRFSTVVSGAEGLGEAIAAGTAALVKASKSVVSTVINDLAAKRSTLQYALSSAQAAFEAAKAAISSNEVEYNSALAFSY